MNSNQKLEKPVSVGNWMLTIIIFSIPVVGFIMMIVWALGGTSSVSKRNYFRASLLLLFIGLVAVILLILAFGGLAMLTMIFTALYNDVISRWFAWLEHFK